MARRRGSRASESTSGVEREPGEVHGVRHPAAGELVGEGAQSQVGVGRRHGIVGVVAGDLVLLHGFTQTGRSWERVREALRPRYRCFAPDLPGHGDAEARRPVTFDAVAAYVGRAQRRSFVAVRLLDGRPARRSPSRCRRPAGRVERLVLVGASPGIADDAERAARREADEALADAHRARRPRRRSWRVGGAAAVRGPAARRRGHRARGPAAQHAPRASRRRCGGWGPA